jgi:hypothetical protein
VPHRGERRLLASLAVLATACALVFIAPEFALAVAPGLALALLVVNGLFPAEEAIGRLRARMACRRPATPPRAASRPRRLAVRPRRRRLHIAFALANRPPPGLVVGD